MDRKQQMLNWLEKEKNKDKAEIEFSKKKIIEQIKSIDKGELFKKETKKISLWTRLKIILWGN
jgi:hypothetical protein